MVLAVQIIGGSGRFPLAFLIVILLLFVAMGWLIWHWSSTGVATLDILKMMFGFLLLIVISGLAIMTLTIAEDVKNDPEIGQILTLLAGLSGGFAQWAFSSKNGEKK